MWAVTDALWGVSIPAWEVASTAWAAEVPMQAVAAACALNGVLGPAWKKLLNCLAALVICSNFLALLSESWKSTQQIKFPRSARYFVDH